MSPAEPLMFHQLASYYDNLVGDKDYRAESRRLEALTRQRGRTRGQAWLDVACGTGRHLSFLRRHHTVTGVDSSREMLRVARRRLPGVRLVLGDMRDFQLHEEFDVVSCLYGAIGHLETERDVETTFVNLAGHLRPGGVAVVEPWIDPAEFHTGSIHLMSRQTRSGVFARMAYSSRRGARSEIHYHYLLGKQGEPVKHVEEVVTGRLIPPARLLKMMACVGLRARFLRQGLTPGRGLLVGIKEGRVQNRRSPSSVGH